MECGSLLHAYKSFVLSSIAPAQREKAKPQSTFAFLSQHIFLHHNKPIEVWQVIIFISQHNAHTYAFLHALTHARGETTNYVELMRRKKTVFITLETKKSTSLTNSNEFSSPFNCVILVVVRFPFVWRIYVVSTWGRDSCNSKPLLTPVSKANAMNSSVLTSHLENV